MKNYLDVSTGKKLVKGDVFTKTIKEQIDDNNQFMSTFKCTLSDISIPILIKKGFIKEVKSNPLTTQNNMKEACIFTINAIAKRMHWKYNKMKEFLITLNNLYPEALRVVLYRVLSLEMNKERKEKDIIHGINKEDVIVSFRPFIPNATKTERHSYFCNKKDAEYAVKVVQTIIDTFNAKREQKD